MCTKSNYQLHKFMLTPKQLKVIKRALSEDIPSSLIIKQERFNGDHASAEQGSYPLPVTESELKHVKDGDGYVTVTLNKKKLKHIRDNKEGGFLPLLTLLPMILGGIGAAGAVASGAAGIVKAVNDKKLNDEKIEEKRHNREIENKLGTGLGKSSKIGWSPCPSCGSPLILKGKKGKGLYLAPYSSGSGLIRAIGDLAHNPATGGQPLPDIPDSIKNIPLIGSLASLLY